jgi:hypothetical protein
MNSTAQTTRHHGRRTPLSSALENAAACSNLSTGSFANARSKVACNQADASDLFLRDVGGISKR